MKTLKFSSKSWHYELAHTFTKYPETGNFCAYVRAVIMGFMYCITFIVIVSAALYVFVIDPLAWLVYYINYGILELETGNVMLVTEIFAFLFAVYDVFYKDRLVDWLDEKRYERLKKKYSTTKKDSFIKSAYRSFKDKVCFRVEFE